MSNGLIFSTTNSPFVLLVAIASSTLTLVVISHRLRNNEKHRNKRTEAELNNIKRLIWAHLTVTFIISLRIMLVALLGEDLSYLLCLDRLIVIAVFLVLGVWWPVYFYFWGHGKTNNDPTLPDK